MPEREATPESVYLERRKFLKALGIGSLSAGLLLAGCDFRSSDAESLPPPPRDPTGRYPTSRNLRFSLDRPVTKEAIAARYNNFYEFSSDKDNVAARAKSLRMSPWNLRASGLVSKPRTFDVDDLLRTMALEERLYRHRCVEAWAMAVPWTGFPLAALLKQVEPRPETRYVRFTTFDHPKPPGMRLSFWAPWPYREGLTMAEATNDLAILATGIYGHPLPPQHGGPIRLVVPWRYDFKSIVGITLTAERPATFWNTMSPEEYDFQANVNPAKPHPRWSQKTERMLGTNERRKTLLYNGYGEWVEGLYKV
ncbi:MAG: mononuclear molybdenum enzyme YedY [Deltaproteobacteria bacterium RBG_13_65_10]|nr:MAG: mononuclear molybdenum enzyme YedY [Deltaproteobacteria bacterium RBG_13_65_10]